MKITDLMIGDIVKITQTGLIISISCIDETYGTVSYWDKEEGAELSPSIDKIEPIPLTPEILVKNGFHIHKNDGKWLGQEARFHLPTDEDVLVLMLDNIGYHVSISWGFHPHFHYVHELQHLFHICGIEKEIIL